MDEIEKFSNILRKRSAEHSEAMSRIHDLPGMMASILRQELDSMVRVIFLLAIADLTERKRLVNQTLSGNVWSVKTAKGKDKKITDREMVEVSNKMEGWTLSVYKFGCAFIHFSNYHDYSESNPFDSLSPQEKIDMVSHLRHYHGGLHSDQPSFSEIAAYFPRVFDKISANLEYSIKELESNKVEHLA